MISICAQNFPTRFPKSMYGGMHATPRRPGFSPFRTQKRRVTFYSNSPFYLHMWRRGRDLNSRYRFKPVYSLSRRAPSAGSDTSPQHRGRQMTDRNAEVQASADRSTCQECSSIGWKLLALPRCFGQGGHRRIDRGRSLA